MGGAGGAQFKDCLANSEISKELAGEKYVAGSLRDWLKIASLQEA